MARIQFDLHVTGTVTETLATAFATAATAFQDRCVDEGLEVRGNGLNVIHDPAPAAEAPAEPSPEPGV